MGGYNRETDYLEYIEKHPESNVIVYGAGNEAIKNRKFVGRINYFCDQRANSIGMIDQIPCILPKELKEIQGNIVVLICIRNKESVGQICAALREIRPDTEIFYFFDNSSFAEFDFSLYARKVNVKDRLRIRIVCVDESWILGKFARKLQEELVKLGQDADIAEEEDPLADVNHYAYYASLAKIVKNPHTVRTSMVTHIDCALKIDLVKFQAQNNVVCICMSSEMVNRLSACGISRNRLCYVNPAQDGEIEPRKTVLGITNRCYGGFDYRKRDNLIVEVCRQISSRYFKWKIMGAGWDQIVDCIKGMGFEVEYYSDFDKGIYNMLIPSLDYWIYYGFDEGAMGYLDALAAGVKTICTPQGYHLDTKCGLTYPCSTIEDFVRVLRKVQEEKKEIVDAVRDWTWENYAKKHLEIWQYMTGAKSLKDLHAHQSEYMDGIFSMILSDIRE